MFKLNKEKYEYLKNNHEFINFFDMISEEFVTKYNYFNRLDEENCLIRYYAPDIGFGMIIPEDIEPISIEDKLKYNLPEDYIVFENGNIIDYCIDDDLVKTISHIDIELQCELLSIVVNHDNNSITNHYTVDVSEY